MVYDKGEKQVPENKAMRNAFGELEGAGVNGMKKDAEGTVGDE